MRFATYWASGTRHYGMVSDQGMIALDPLFPAWATLRDAIAADGLPVLARVAAGRDVTHRVFTYDVPIPNPGKIFAVESDAPDLSIGHRIMSGFTAHDTTLIRPPEAQMLDYGATLAIVIGRAGRRISQVNAYRHIAALTLCNDRMMRDWPNREVTTSRNHWDKSGSIGPWITQFKDATQLDDAHIEARVNGELRQDAKLSSLPHSPRRVIEYISTFTTLSPGDIILLGTPKGRGADQTPPRYLAPGDKVEIRVEGLGTLRNSAEAEAP